MRLGMDGIPVGHKSRPRREGDAVTIEKLIIGGLILALNLAAYWLLVKMLRSRG